MARSVASLAMYPFPHLRDATDRLWRAVAARFPGAPDALEWTVLTPEVWTHPDLLVAQCCGWPLVTVHAARLCVVGTFDHDVPGAYGGTYCSVIVTSDPAATLDELRVRPALRAVVNSHDSLSGRVSLEHVMGPLGSTGDTGAHLQSVRALAEGRADIASIDAVTWALIAEHYPALVAGLRVIGDGPRVGCLPLVMRQARREDVPAMREAFAAAVADPAVADACRALHIRGFVAKDVADYLPIRSLVP